jgi:hypothetical protein
VKNQSAPRAWTGLTAAVASVLAAAACAPGETTPTATDTGSLSATATPSSSSSSTPSSTVTPTSTVAPPTVPSHVWVFGDEWTTNPPDQAQGSGCTPGATSLPDGVWFGFAESWSTSQIAFDMACWWTGDKAMEVGLAHGFEDAYDYYITNDNSTIRLVTVPGNIPAMKAGWEDGIFTLTQVIADPGGSLPTNHPYPVWIYVNGGVVTQLAVQYIP